MTRQGAACENGVNKIGKARLNFIQTNWQRVHILRLDFIQSLLLVRIPHILVQRALPIVKKWDGNKRTSLSCRRGV